MYRSITRPGLYLGCRHQLQLGPPFLGRPADTYHTGTRQEASMRKPGSHVIQFQKDDCSQCGKVFQPVRDNQRFCSTECRNAIYELGRIESVSQLSCGTSGAVKELVVSVDLMSKRFHVFRALSPSCPCDLIALSDNHLLRVEVKSVCCKRDGSPVVPQLDYCKFDLLALVDPRLRVYYRYAPSQTHLACLQESWSSPITPE